MLLHFPKFFPKKEKTKGPLSRKMISTKLKPVNKKHKSHIPPSILSHMFSLPKKRLNKLLKVPKDPRHKHPVSPGEKYDYLASLN